jgi:hypothetical protein
MKNSIFTIFLLFGFIGCIPPQPKQNSAKTNANTTPQLYVYGIDLSQTCKDFLKPNNVWFSNFIQNRLKQTNGDLIMAIGSIADATDAPIPITAFVPVPHLVDVKATQSNQNKQKAQEDSVRNFNFNLCSSWLNEVKANPIFTKYDSVLAKETDINGFLFKAQSIINNPKFANYEKHLVLITDGINDVKGKHKISTSLQKANLLIHLIGTKNTKPFVKYGTVSHQSIEDFYISINK